MSETTTEPTAAVGEPRDSLAKKLFSGAAGRNIGLIIALLLLIIVGAVTAGDRFMDFDNVLSILRFSSVIGVVAIGMTFVITAAGIDLSVGSVLGLASVTATISAIQSGSWLLMIAVALLTGALAGLINGIIIAYGKVVAFMATLAMLVAARGTAELVAQRQTKVVNNNEFLEFFRGDIVGVDTLIWIFVLSAVAGWILLNRTTFGRRTVAIGGNPTAARLAGVNVRRHTMYLYILAGVGAGIAGTMMLGRTTAGTSTHGMLYELDAIAAVVVGGTLLAGGRGTIVGTVLGVLLFATLTNVFTQNNLSTSVQLVAKGVIIVVAVMLQQRFADREPRAPKKPKPAPVTSSA